MVKTTKKLTSALSVFGSGGVAPRVVACKQDGVLDGLHHRRLRRELAPQAAPGSELLFGLKWYATAVVPIFWPS